MPKEKKAERKYFDKDYWTKLYSKKKGYTWRKEPTPYLKKKTALLKKRKVKKILDIGCGDGRNLIYLSKKGFLVTGLEIDKSILEKCMRMADKEKAKNYVLVEGVAEKLPFPDSHFDAIVCVTVLESIKRKKKALDEMSRVLKKRGILIMQETIKYSTPDKKIVRTRFKEGEIEALLKSAGFKTRDSSILEFYDEKGHKGSKLWSRPHTHKLINITSEKVKR